MKKIITIFFIIIIFSLILYHITNNVNHFKFISYKNNQLFYTVNNDIVKINVPNGYTYINDENMLLIEHYIINELDSDFPINYKYDDSEFSIGIFNKNNIWVNILIFPTDGDKITPIQQSHFNEIRNRLHNFDLKTDQIILDNNENFYSSCTINNNNEITYMNHTKISYINSYFYLDNMLITARFYIKHKDNINEAYIKNIYDQWKTIN